MPAFEEVLEAIREEESDVRAMFERHDTPEPSPTPTPPAPVGPHPLQEAGERRVGRRGRRGNDPAYMARLVEAARFYREVLEGRRPAYHLREALTTSDFPELFGDIIDRQLLGAYREAPQTFRAYTRVGTVPDFRDVKRIAVDGAEGELEEVAEQEEYPETELSETPYTYHVRKYGRRIPFSWEAFINDDLDALRDTPNRFGRAARRSEERFATKLFVDANGPHASFYTVGNNNIVTSNPVLSIAALQTALQVLAAQTDADGEPILLDVVHLVVPPALMVTAMNILNGLQIETTEQGGTANQRLIAQNWMKNMLQLHVNRYIPIIASTANGNTSWFLFGSPSDGRPALEVGFLRGHTEPEVFVKEPNARRVGGATNPEDGDFLNDSIEYKVRHVFGGVRIDPKVTVASQGDGS